MFGEAGSPPVLVLIDLQQGTDDPPRGPRNNPNAERTARQPLSVWRELTLPIVHVRHDSTEQASPLRRGSPGFEYKAGLSPQEGETENRGLYVYVVEDATATFGRTLADTEFDAETIHRTALAQLREEFAEIVQAEQIFDAVKLTR